MPDGFQPKKQFYYIIIRDSGLNSLLVTIAKAKSNRS
jgi:hypothetical protein